MGARGDLAIEVLRKGCPRGRLIGSRSGEALSQGFPVTIALAPASRRDLDLIPVSD
jgi:hypothetical protein